MRLKNWKTPRTGKVCVGVFLSDHSDVPCQSSAGDFPAILYEELKNRIPHDSGGRILISDVNHFLDRICEATET